MHPSLPQVFSHIETNQENYIQRLIDYVRNPSISAHNIGIREVSEILIEMLTKIGFETQAIPTAGHPMVLGRWEKEPVHPRFCSTAITMSSPLIPWSLISRRLNPPFARRLTPGSAKQRPTFRPNSSDRGPPDRPWGTTLQRALPAGGRRRYSAAPISPILCIKTAICWVPTWSSPPTVICTKAVCPS